MTEQQFSPLAERYMDTVFRVAYSYLRSPADADDVTQDVLLQLYKTDKAFDDDAHVKNWLIRVTVNRCKNVLRAPWHRTEDIADYENSLSFEEPQCHELFDAVMALDRRYRVPVLLYYYEGYRQKEIAGLLDIPEETVRTRLARAREKLKHILSEVPQKRQKSTGIGSVKKYLPIPVFYDFFCFFRLLEIYAINPRQPSAISIQITKIVVPCGRNMS